LWPWLLTGRLQPLRRNVKWRRRLWPNVRMSCVGGKAGLLWRCPHTGKGVYRRIRTKELSQGPRCCQQSLCVLLRQPFRHPYLDDGLARYSQASGFLV